MKEQNTTRKIKYIVGIVLLLAVGGLLIAAVLSMEQISVFGDYTVRSEISYVVLILALLEYFGKKHRIGASGEEQADDKSR